MCHKLHPRDAGPGRGTLVGGGSIAGLQGDVAPWCRRPRVSTDPVAARALRLSAVMQAAAGADPLGGICRTALTVLGASGSSMALINGGPPTPLAWSDAVSSRLEELQQTLGEGPCVDAHESGRPVSEPSLAHPRRPRWAAFTAAALDMGVAALFSFPLRMGGVRLGAFTAHRTVGGGLSDEQHADARAVATVATATILMEQSEAAPGALARDLEPLMAYSAVLHQAAGMISVQLGIGVGEALACVRAYAFAAERPLGEVASDVVARRLRLDE